MMGIARERFQCLSVPFSPGKKTAIKLFFSVVYLVPSELLHLPLKCIHLVAWDTLMAWRVLESVQGYI